jgi:hypothetical protein
MYDEIADGTSMAYKTYQTQFFVKPHGITFIFNAVNLASRHGYSGLDLRMEASDI